MKSIIPTILLLLLSCSAMAFQMGGTITVHLIDGSTKQCVNCEEDMMGQCLWSNPGKYLSEEEIPFTTIVYVSK